ncbi:RNA polymerase sigma factor [Clostridium sp. AM58-1XD]|uniref:RNA polymerase sigma factor n=1 Tax=Clostridium sp. AM58-1XD TaxID=2292307 RepID=UPI000E472C4D|nr:RNA polymerase sigma factor [Clostridium sp. AM58-1XD]RGY95330.1 RNA polymerase sigma factor [Clostridium sp. AM58-1XD]
MNLKYTDLETRELIERSVEGNKEALEMLLTSIQDIVFNMSLRMLGTVPDAEDAAQDILIRVMTKLSSFRGECMFQTWVYRLAVNYLLNYKKSMFVHRPLDFEFYGNDIRYAKIDEADEIIDEVSREQMADELKLSCTNVLLQCLDAESRCIFIMGTMFKISSTAASDVLGISPAAYRQRLSRSRKKVADFLEQYCGLAGSPLCSCKKRVAYAVSQGRINPQNLEYAGLHPLKEEVLSEYREEMEHLDALACSFEAFPCYQSPVSAGAVIEQLINSEHYKRIRQFPK